MLLFGILTSSNRIFRIDFYARNELALASKSNDGYYAHLAASPNPGSSELLVPQRDPSSPSNNEVNRGHNLLPLLLQSNSAVHLLWVQHPLLDHLVCSLATDGVPSWLPVAALGHYDGLFQGCLGHTTLRQVLHGSCNVSRLLSSPGSLDCCIKSTSRGLQS